MAMTAAKITTAITIALICLLGITTSVIIFYTTGDRRSSLPAPASAAAPIASEPPEFMKVYGLDDGQILKRVVNAPASIRDAYVEKYYRFPVGSIFMSWKDNFRAGSENFPPSYRLVDILTLPVTVRPLSLTSPSPTCRRPLMTAFTPLPPKSLKAATHFSRTSPARPVSRGRRSRAWSAVFLSKNPTIESHRAFLGRCGRWPLEAGKYWLVK